MQAPGLLREPPGSSDGVLSSIKSRLASLQTTIADLPQPGSPGQLSPALSRENAALRRRVNELEAANRQLRSASRPGGESIAATLGLPAQFEFGRRIYQCTVPEPGVGYRFTPAFADKNNDGRGPGAPQCIVADGICQGPDAVFIRCVSGAGWLPLTDPDGTRSWFKHIGPEAEVDVKVCRYWSTGMLTEGQALGLELADRRSNLAKAERVQPSSSRSSSQSPYQSPVHIS